MSTKCDVAIICGKNVNESLQALKEKDIISPKKTGKLRGDELWAYVWEWVRWDDDVEEVREVQHVLDMVEPSNDEDDRYIFFLTYPSDLEGIQIEHYANLEDDPVTNELICEFYPQHKFEFDFEYEAEDVPTEAVIRAEHLLVENGIAPEKVSMVLQTIGRTLFKAELYPALEV